MTESMITLQGFVGAEPVVRTAGGHTVANFRVACTPRRLNRATGEWADAPTQWYTVNAWRRLGDNVARSLRKGDAVVVHGRLSARSYVNKDGLEVNTFEVEASVVGHDLNRGLTQLIRNERRNDPYAAVPARGHGGDGVGVPLGGSMGERDDRLTGPEREREDALAAAQRDWGAMPVDEPPGFESAGPEAGGENAPVDTHGAEEEAPVSAA